MNTKFRKIGILTSGGDAPGMNACVRSVTRTAIARGIEVVGILGGYSGLLENKIRPLGTRDVSGIVNLGGTFLYSNRCLEFQTEEGMQKALATCRENEIDGIIAIGGDGTFRGATELSRRGVPTIGLTGSIDNDITASDYTLGFDTAMNTVCEMVDRLRDTCESHARCNVIEVMGRNCGEIALHTAIATGAVAVAIPEMPFDEAAAIEKMRMLRGMGKRNFLVMVSEGLGTYSEELAKKIEAETKIETKFARLAHVVRGGRPTLRDRLFAAEVGSYATELLLEGKSDLVVVERKGQLVDVEINYALILDRMYKNKLKEGDLDAFTPEQIQSMKDLCAERSSEIKRLYQIAYELA